MRIRTEDLDGVPYAFDVRIDQIQLEQVRPQSLNSGSER